MNILAIDYGKKRIGLAWIDTAIGVVLPFGIVEKEKLPQVILDEKIQKVIVGLPIGLDGDENENTGTVRAFVDDLKKLVTIPIEFVDERFTSAEADRMEGDASRDEKAAMLILQTYLDKRAS